MNAKRKTQNAKRWNPAVGGMDQIVPKTLRSFALYTLRFELERSDHAPNH